MASLSDRLRSQIKVTDTLQRLLMINIVVFLIVRIIHALSSLFLYPILDFEQVSSVIAIPAKCFTANYKAMDHHHLHVFSLGCDAYFIQHAVALLDGQNFPGISWKQETPKNVSFAGGISGAIFFVIAYNLFPLFRQFSPRCVRTRCIRKRTCHHGRHGNTASPVSHTVVVFRCGAAENGLR